MTINNPLDAENIDPVFNETGWVGTWTIFCDQNSNSFDHDVAVAFRSTWLSSSTTPTGPARLEMTSSSTSTTTKRRLRTTSMTISSPSRRLVC